MLRLYCMRFSSTNICNVAAHLCMLQLQHQQSQERSAKRHLVPKCRLKIFSVLAILVEAVCYVTKLKCN